MWSEAMIASLFALQLWIASSPDEQQTLKRAAANEAARVRQAPEDSEALYRLGLAYLKLGEPAKAVPPLRALVKKNLAAVDATVLLARALRLSGEVDEARSLLDAAIASLPGESALRSERGLLARWLNDNDGAIDAYRKAVELAPKDAELRFNLGEALHKRGKLDPAIASYREALNLNPELAAAQVNLGKALADKGLYVDAKDVLTAAARKTLTDPEAHYNLAVLLMREDNVQLAIAEYERALAIDPRHALAHNNLGVALDGIGNHQRASEEFRKAIATDPRYVEAHFNLGLSYFRLGDNLRATRQFEKALELEPRQASDPYVQLGNLYLQQGKRDRAVEAFKRAIAAMKDNRHPTTDAYRGLALAYRGLHKPEEAVNTLKIAVEAFPRDPSAHAALAEAEVAQGNLPAAIEEYGKRLKLEPTTEAKLELAQVYARHRQSAPAESLYQQVLKENPQDRGALLGISDLQLALGRYDEAEKSLQRIQKLDREDIAPLARLGILHARRGRPDLALPELEEVAAKDPTQLDARAELGFLYTRGGDPDQGLRVLSSVLHASPRQALALLYLGHTLYQKGQAQRAEQAFLASSRVDPSAAEPHYALGQLYEAQKKLQDARGEYDRAVALQKDHVDAVAAVKRLSAASR